MFKLTIGNYVIDEAGDLMYAILGKAEKHVLYEELIGTSEHLTLQTRCRINLCHYNKVKLYCDSYSK
jgi:hypothetical protein